MGSFLDTPITDKEVEDNEGNSVRWGVAAMQGWRVSMEDTHVCRHEIGVGGCGFFGVFDGHGGERAAGIVAENIVNTIQSQPNFSAAAEAEDVEQLKQCLTAAHYALDSKIEERPEFRSLDDRSGCTSITCLMTPNYLIVCNTGDSRSVMATNGQTKAMSEDHKPDNPIEHQRIISAGGHVAMKRVNGDLAVSRAFGDFTYKQAVDQKGVRLSAAAQLVAVTPEIRVHERTQDDEFIVLACDGIWDVMSNDECIDFVRKNIAGGEHTLSRVMSNLLDHCLEKGSRDNMSAAVVTLAGCKYGPKRVAPPAAAPATKVSAENAGM